MPWWLHTPAACRKSVLQKCAVCIHWMQSKGLGFPNKHFAAQKSPLYIRRHYLLALWGRSKHLPNLIITSQEWSSVFKLNLKRTVVFLLGKVPSWHSIANRTSYPTLSLFTKVLLAFSCKPPKVACFQNFLLTKLDLCGNPFQQFNITYLLRVPARLPKEPEQVFNFLIAT